MLTRRSRSYFAINAIATLRFGQIFSWYSALSPPFWTIFEKDSNLYNQVREFPWKVCLERRIVQTSTQLLIIAVLARNLPVVSHRPFSFQIELLNKTEQKTAFVYQGKVFQLQVHCKSKSSWESSRLLSFVDH